MEPSDLAMAWRDHVSKLTLAQLMSTDACRAHTEQFQVKLVADGLGGTPLCGLQDMHELISSFVREGLALDAIAVKRLMQIQRDVYIADTVQEITKAAMERAMEGPSSLGGIQKLEKLKSFKDFMKSERNDGYEVIVKKLRDMGYTVDTWTTDFDFRLNW